MAKVPNFSKIADLYFFQQCMYAFLFFYHNLLYFFRQFTKFSLTQHFPNLLSLERIYVYILIP